MKCKCKAIIKVISPSPATIVASNVTVIDPNPDIDKLMLECEFNIMKALDLVDNKSFTLDEYILAYEYFQRLAKIQIYGG